VLQIFTPSLPFNFYFHLHLLFSFSLLSSFSSSFSSSSFFLSILCYNRIIRGLLESINSYDTPLEVYNYINKCLNIKNNSIVAFYQKALHDLFSKFPFSKIGLQYLLLSTQGMTERELRLALNKENADRTEWIEFCFSSEPAFIIRSGIYLRIANRHASEALLLTFDSEYDRIAISKKLIHCWEKIIIPTNEDNPSVLRRRSKEKSSLLYRSWEAYPSLSMIDGIKYNNPSWEFVNMFRKSQHECRDSLWILLSQWDGLSKSLSSTNTKMTLLHYLAILPKSSKITHTHYFNMIMMNFISQFHLPNNFFKLKNLFSAKEVFRPKNAKKIGIGLIKLAKFINLLKSHFSTNNDILIKLIAPSSKVQKSDLGYPLCKNNIEMYCSSSIICEEELSLLERGVLVLCGIPGFNSTKSIDFNDRFYKNKSLGEECIPELVNGCLRISKLAKLELIGCAKVLRSYRHRIILPPLRKNKNINIQLLNQLNYLVNTVMLDGPSSCIKAIVQKLKFKLLSIKTLCKLLLNVDQSDKEIKNNVWKTINTIVDALGDGKR
jgi:hypothetical protein